MNDDTFDALANESRRTLLVALLVEDSQPDTVHSPPDEDGWAARAEQVSRLRLYHVHLPKLEDYGFIQWNKDRGEVTRGPQYAEIRPLLEWIDAQAEH